jgi:SAM-dependent methyltransferase
MSLPIPLLVAADVRCDHFTSAAALELECQKTVSGADVEASLAADIRPGELADDRPQIEQAGRHHSRRDLDRVIPPWHLVDRTRCVLVHIAVAEGGHRPRDRSMCPMAHRLIYGVVSDIAARLELPEPIVEFGSMQVEQEQPNDLRPVFDGRSFIGTDFRAGPGVDRIEDLRRLSFADGEVGTALCLDTLEHCEDPIAAARELHRVVSPEGGVCVITSVMLIGIHGYPSDYWRFTPSGLRVLLAGFDDLDVAAMGDPSAPFWVFGVATKGRKLDLRLDELPSLASSQREYLRAEGKLKLGPFRYSLRELAGELRGELPRVVRERAAAKLRRQPPSGRLSA